MSKALPHRASPRGEARSTAVANLAGRSRLAPLERLSALSVAVLALPLALIAADRVTGADIGLVNFAIGRVTTREFLPD